MPVSCCIKNCKSTWKKNSNIKFYRFPFKNSMTMKYWIAATGRNNWSPYSDARICNLHFKDNDYHNNEGDIKRRHLKRNVIPTQNVHPNILQMLQQNAHNLEMSQLEDRHKINADGQSNSIIKKEELIEENDETVLTNPKCSKCAELVKKNNQSKLKIGELEKLLEERLKKIDELEKLQEERLNQQANMFRELMSKKEAVLKDKLDMVRNKNKILSKSIQRKGKKISNLKTLARDSETSTKKTSINKTLTRE